MSVDMMQQAMEYMTGMNREAAQEGSIESYGVMAALEEMIPHWKSHLKDGNNPAIMATDLLAVEQKLREVRCLIEDHFGVKREGTRISLDNGQTSIPVTQGVRVYVEDILVDGEEDSGALDFNFTEEGVITDLWVSREDTLDHNLGTESETYEEIQHRLARMSR